MSERERFEVWARSHKCPEEAIRLGEDYGGSGVVCATWHAWQGAVAAERARIELEVSVVTGLMTAQRKAILRAIRGGIEPAPSDPAAGRGEIEPWLRALLWDEHLECCGRPVVGAEYGGMQEQVCCGCAELSLLNDAQIVASLRAAFPEPPPAAPGGQAEARGADEQEAQR